MANDRPSPSHAGLMQDPAPARPHTIELLAIVLTVVWFVICMIFRWLPGIDWSGVANLTWLVGLLVPIGLIWLAVATVKMTRELSQESQSLRAELARLADSRAAPAKVANAPADPALLQQVQLIADRQAELVAQLDLLNAERMASQPAMPVPEPDHYDEPQSSLSLGTPPEALDTPITIAEFIRALDFPENEQDVEGFKTLRKALRDRGTQKLVRASQDALTLLSQDGIYMDDLRPDRARPELWRAFARGERGRAVASLGGVHDRSSLALAAGRLKQDPVFRDATHHFLRAFDQTFMEFERHASDEDIIHLANTRTARAFMLLGRVAGTFD